MLVEVFEVEKSRVGWFYAAGYGESGADALLEYAHCFSLAPEPVPLPVSHS